MNYRTLKTKIDVITQFISANMYTKTTSYTCHPVTLKYRLDLKGIRIFNNFVLLTAFYFRVRSAIHQKIKLMSFYLFLYT